MTVDVTCPATTTSEEIRDATGALRGHLVRRAEAVTGRVVLATEPLPGPYGALRLRLDVVNDGVADPSTPRAEALRTALISAHTVLGLDRGAFLSSADPPQWAAPAVAACVNAHSWPVLAGPPGDGSLLLATPIILEDHPQLAPESPTNLFDGTENDEILALRTLALTDDEKREARATDPRAAHIVDAVDAMGPAMFERLHGAIRPDGRAPDDIPTIATPGTPWWDPGADASVDPDSDEALVDGRPVARGSSVILMPGRGSDAQDTFLRGAAATVAGRPARRRRRHPRRRVDRRRPGRRPPGHPRPLPLLPARRAGGAAAGRVMKILVAGVGNVFFSDDGFGSEVARRLLAAPGDAAAVGGRRRRRHPRDAPRLPGARRLRGAGRRRRRAPAR